MIYTRLGSSALRISKLGLGTWLTVAERLPYDRSRDVLAKAMEQGINYFDTSNNYASGEAETYLGRILGDYPRRDWVLSSKCYFPTSDRGPQTTGLSRANIHGSTEASLRRLNTDYLDILFLHRFDANTPLDEVADSVGRLVSGGKVRHWGVSRWPLGKIEEVMGLCTRMGIDPPVAVQDPYNLLNPEYFIEFEKADLGIGFIGYSVLARGVLSAKYNAGVDPESRGAVHPDLMYDLNDENLSRVEKLVGLAQKRGVSVSTLVLAYYLSTNKINSYLFGVSDVEQLKANLESVALRLSDQEMDAIEDV